jgi:hypothetical protein
MLWATFKGKVSQMLTGKAFRIVLIVGSGPVFIKQTPRTCTRSKNAAIKSSISEVQRIFQTYIFPDST